MQDILHRFKSAMPGEIGKVHTFAVKDHLLAYDAVSGALHGLSPLGYAVIEIYDKDPFLLNKGFEGSLPVVLQSLEGKFSKEDIEEAVFEIFQKYGRTLWVKDTEITQKDERTPLKAGLKALCLDIAHDCNLACRYCFAYGGTYGGDRTVMTAEMGIRAIEFLAAKSKGRKFLDVDFFGGEPMMAFGTVKKCIERARELEKETGKIFRFTLTTNCTLLDDESISYLISENVSFILSIDGRKETHDAMRIRRDGSESYDQVLKWAKKVAEKTDDYIVRGTYTKKNLDFYKDVESLYRQGFRHISLEGAVGEGEWGLSLDDMDEIGQSYDKLLSFFLKCKEEGDPFSFYHFELGLKGGMCRERRMTGCGAGYEYAALTPEGNIYPCHQLVGKEDYIMGDIFSPFPKNKNLSETFYEARVPYKEKCRECWARYLCGGGCHAQAIFSNDDIKSPCEVTCALMKQRLEYALCGQYIISL